MSTLFEIGDIEEARGLRLRSIALGYHDVVDRMPTEDDALRACPSLYTLVSFAFREHLQSILERTSQTSVMTVESCGDATERPVFLTFDDGALGAYECIAPELERNGWRGHFFIVSDWIGKPGFMNADQIRQLRQRGHMIGSHSQSHPERISGLSDSDLLKEWTESSAVLRDVLAETVKIASVPNGFYSKRVGRAVGAAGIEVLFNSEPTTYWLKAEGVTVLGRYAIFADTPPAVAGALAAGSNWPRWRQAAAWQVKKAAKTVGGESYLKLRREVLSRIRPG